MKMSIIDAGGDVREEIVYAQNFGRRAGQAATTTGQVRRDPIAHGGQAAVGKRVRCSEGIGVSRMVRKGERSGSFLSKTKRQAQRVGAVFARFNDVRGQGLFRPATFLVTSRGDQQ